MENIDDDNYFTWTIDRTPDHSLYNSGNLDNYINDDYEINEDMYDEFNYSALIRIPEIINLINNIVYTHDTDDFIPFKIPFDINYAVETINISSEEELNCCICMETKRNNQICQLDCMHKFCSNCIFHHIDKNRTNSCCPLCRSSIWKITLQTEEDIKKFLDL